MANNGRFSFIIAALLLLTFEVQAFDPEEPDESYPKFNLDAFIDLRGISSDSNRSWLDGGLGKTRYGGNDNGRDEYLRASQLSTLFHTEFNEDFSFELQANIDAEPDRQFAKTPIDIIEAFANYSTLLSDDIQSDTKVGIFFPPVSLEHIDPAWTSPYTITPSAANSWIADEVRTVGIESSVSHFLEHGEITLGGSLFMANDAAGSLLAWRGWTLGNRLTSFTEDLPLPDIPSLSEDGLFPKQGDVDIFEEVDNRPGYYISLLAADYRYAEFSLLYYDNQGDPTAFDGTQYSWETRFWNAGIRIPVSRNFELLTQLMAGESNMGPGGDLERVGIDFYTFYFMASYRYWEHRFSLRFDRFRVKDDDLFVEEDNNNEIGSAWTAAYFYEFTKDVQLGLEVLRVNSDRPAFETIGLNPSEIELQVQTRLKILF